MKRNRVIWAILWIASLVGISFFGGPVSYGFFALLTFAPLISMIYLLFVYFFFRIYQELDGKRLVANRVMPFYFTLMNECHFGFVGIRVRFFSSFSAISGLDDGVEYELLPRTGIKKQTGLTCKYRGEYEVGIKTVELQDFFRLLRISYHNREALRVIVKPNPVELLDLRGVDLSQTMARSAQNHPTERDVLVRGYEPGDDLRQVNWKASARSGELLVRKLIGEEREGVGILMGTNRCSRDPKEYLPVENKMLETAIALTLFFAKKNVPVRSYHAALGLKELSVYGLAQFDAYYEEMSNVEFREEVTEAMLLEQAAARPELFRCKTVFLVLREWTGEALRMAGLLRENNVFTMIYLVRDDVPENLPRTKLPGMEVTCVGTASNLAEVI